MLAILEIQKFYKKSTKQKKNQKIFYFSLRRHTIIFHIIFITFYKIVVKFPKNHKNHKEKVSHIQGHPLYIIAVYHSLFLDERVDECGSSHM